MHRLKHLSQRDYVSFSCNQSPLMSVFGVSPFKQTNMNIYTHFLCINLKFARFPRNAVYINIDKKNQPACPHNTDKFQLIILNMFTVILSFCHACLWSFCMFCKNKSVMWEVLCCLISFYIFVNVCDGILLNIASPLCVCVLYVCMCVCVCEYTAECTKRLCVCVCVC